MNTLIPHLQDIVQNAVDTLTGVERRRVLASDGWFTRGKLIALVSRQARIIVRLPEDAAATELLALDGAGHWRIKNRKPLKDWIMLPETMHDDAEAVGEWVKRAWALGQTAKAPARAKKTAPKPRKAAKSRKPVKRAAPKRRKTAARA